MTWIHRRCSVGFGLRASGLGRDRDSSPWPEARGPWLLLAFIFPIILSAQRSPFNGLEVLPADSNGHYRILIGGHFHGESTNRSGYPAATLLANIDTINSLGANLFLSTGDLFMDPVNDLPRYQKAFFSKLKMPFFNAPGNHDVGDSESSRGAYYVPLSRCTSERLAEAPDVPSGTTLSDKPGRSWDYRSPIECLFLDTELSGGITDQQFARLNDMLDDALSMDSCALRTLFIISHRPIWAEEDPQYSPLFQGNTRSVLGTNFQKDVYPLLEQIAKHAHVYWISGSMGGTAQSSIFFQPHAPNITFIQSAIRDEPRDALLIADVYPDTVKWSALSLTGQKLLAPEAYDAAWWRARLGHSEGFNWKLLPYLVKTTVLHRAFWWGAGLMLLLVLLVRRLLRR